LFIIIDLVVTSDWRAFVIGPLDDPVLRALTIALIYIAFAFAARVTALLTLAYWNHFANIVLFDYK
jgi:hypothetical protein